MKLRPRHFQKNFNLKLPSLPSFLGYLGIIPFGTRISCPFMFPIPPPLPPPHPCLSLTMHLDAITDNSMASNNAVTIKLKLSRPEWNWMRIQAPSIHTIFQIALSRYECIDDTIALHLPLSFYPVDRRASNFRSLERSEDWINVRTKEDDIAINKLDMRIKWYCYFYTTKYCALSRSFRENS